MPNSNLFDLNDFSRKVERSGDRISQLLDQVTVSPAFLPEITPAALKELGVVSEELEVALEELKWQNEALLGALDQAALLQHRYQDFFDKAPEAYLLTDVEGTIQLINQAAAELLGDAAPVFLDQPLDTFIKERDRSLLRIKLLQVQQGKQPQEWNLCLKPSGKAEILARCLMGPVWDADCVIGVRFWLSKTAESSFHREGGSSDLLINQELSKYPIYTFNRGDLISLEPSAVWLTLQGVVKLTTLAENNGEILVGLANPGMLFGMHLTALPLYQATALSRTQLRSIPITELENSSELSARLIPKIHRRLQQAEMLTSILGQRRVLDRLRLFLEFLKREIGEPLPEGGLRLSVRLTHEDFASACCTTRVTVTRMLGQLQQQGKIMCDDSGHLVFLSALL